MVGRAEPHCLNVLHPYQDRVLSILENKRIQVCYHAFTPTPLSSCQPSRPAVRSLALRGQKYAHMEHTDVLNDCVAFWTLTCYMDAYNISYLARCPYADTTTI